MRPVYRSLLLGVSLLGGCGDGDAPDVMFERLLERMSNVTGVAPGADVPAAAIPAYPRPRELLLPLDDMRVGFGTFLGLGQCHLLGEVSARNSSLGKVQSATARLLYELRFHRQVKSCLHDLERSQKRDEEFITTVQQIEIRKRANLPAVFWNATFASPEFRVLLNTAAEPLARGAEPTSAELTGALGFIARIGQTLESDDEAIDATPLESRYFVIQSGKLVGPLLQGMAQGRAYLARGTDVLETVASQDRLCPAGHKTPRGEYLFNVFRKYYIGEVQPYLSLLHTTARPLFEALHEVLEAQKVPPPPAFQAFYDATLNPDTPNSLWIRFNQDIARHTRAWQHVLKQCELMPTATER